MAVSAQLHAAGGEAKRLDGKPAGVSRTTVAQRRFEQSVGGDRAVAPWRRGGQYDSGRRRDSPIDGSTHHRPRQPTPPFTTSVLVLRVLTIASAVPPSRDARVLGETQEWPAGPRPTTRWSQTGARYPSRRAGRLDVRARARLTTAMATNKPAPTADRTRLSPGLKRGQRAASPICGSELVPAAPHAARERLVVRRCICVAARPERASSGHQRRRLLRAPSGAHARERSMRTVARAAPSTRVAAGSEIRS